MFAGDVNFAKYLLTLRSNITIEIINNFALLYLCSWVQKDCTLCVRYVFVRLQSLQLGVCVHYSHTACVTCCKSTVCGLDTRAPCARKHAHKENVYKPQ